MHEHDHRGGPVVVSVPVASLLLVGDFAPAPLSPLAGAVSDRFDPRRVMIAAELVQGGLIMAITITLPPLLIATVGIRLVAGCALLAAVSTRVSMVVLLLTGFVVSSVGNLLTGLAWAVAAAFTVQTDGGHRRDARAARRRAAPG